VSQIPFDFYTLQDLLAGNPIFMDTNVIAFKTTETRTLVTILGKEFKHLLTLSADKNLLLHSKLDDVNLIRSRTADITYDDYESKDGITFSTYREITVSEKNKLDIRMNYKQYEFNKNVSVAFSIPKNYKQK
jgi:activator of HSP90 ATPase